MEGWSCKTNLLSFCEEITGLVDKGNCML